MCAVRWISPSRSVVRSDEVAALLDAGRQQRATPIPLRDPRRDSMLDCILRSLIQIALLPLLTYNALTGKCLSAECGRVAVRLDCRNPLYNPCSAVIPCSLIRVIPT